MRSKEEAHDYRYFPDPDLLPLTFDDAFVGDAKASLPELPDAKKARYVETLSLSDYNAAVLTAEQESAVYFEALLSALAEKAGKPEAELARSASNFVISDLFGALNKAGKSISDSPVSAQEGAGLLALQADGSISGRIAKDVFEIMFETGQPAAQIVEEKGLKQVSDTGALEAIVADVLSANPGQVEQYKAGKDKLIGFFVGQVMKATKGQANPAVVNELLKKALGPSG